ncbi:hypothetical protein [Streptomyces sp900105245]
MVVDAVHREPQLTGGTGTDEAAARWWLDSLMADGRYVEDVYAAG